MRRPLALLFGATAYVLSVAPMVYLVGFLAGVGLPKTVNSGPFVPAGRALAVDLGLLASFAVVHSLLAREPAKRVVARWVGSELERSVYSALAGLQIVALLVFWRALPETVWRIETPALRAGIWLLFAGGWVVVLAALHAVGSLRLFGLAQAWEAYRGTPETPAPITRRGPYRFVRHPLYSGTILSLFAAPTMSRGHLLLATSLTAYILVGMVFEERDLARKFGASWLDYRRVVPALVPRFGK